MKPLFCLIPVCFFVFISCCSMEEINFKKTSERKAKKYFKNYTSSDSLSIAKIFSPNIAMEFRSNESRYESFAFSEDEIDTLNMIFGKEFSKIISLKPSSTKIDGYRIHFGIKKGIKSKIAFTVTFGVKKKRNNTTIMKRHREFYLSDSLELGIYRICLPREHKIPISNAKKKITILTHFSCNPDCLGDKIR